MYVPRRVDVIDVFLPSNLNRQILANVHTIGRRKTEVAIERVKALYISCQLTLRALICRIIDADCYYLRRFDIFC